MCPALPLAQIASEGWKSTAFDAVAFAYRIAGDIRTTSGAYIVSRKLWSLDKAIKEIQEPLYRPISAPPPEAPPRERLEEAVQAIRALRASFENLGSALSASRLSNHGKIAAPLRSALERIDDLAEFADVVELTYDGERKAEVESIFDHALAEFHNGETVEIGSLMD